MKTVWPVPNPGWLDSSSRAPIIKDDLAHRASQISHFFDLVFELSISLRCHDEYRITLPRLLIQYFPIASKVSFACFLRQGSPACFSHVPISGAFCSPTTNWKCHDHGAERLKQSADRINRAHECNETGPIVFDLARAFLETVLDTPYNQFNLVTH